MRKVTLITLFTISTTLIGVIVYYLTLSSTVDRRPIFEPFEINYNVTEASLVDSAYEPIPEDVPLFGKRLGNTYVYYQLNSYCDSTGTTYTNVSNRFYNVYFDTINSHLLDKFVRENDAEIITDLLHINEIEDDASPGGHGLKDIAAEEGLSNLHKKAWGFHATFFVQHNFTKQIFMCYIGGSTGSVNGKNVGFELHVDTYFPWTREQIEKSRWIYDSKKSMD